MKVTNVGIKKVEKENSRLRGMASITIDNCLVIHNIRIIAGDKGLFIAMPSKRVKDKFFDIVHPINPETRKIFEDAIISQYNENE